MPSILRTLAEKLLVTSAFLALLTFSLMALLSTENPLEAIVLGLFGFILFSALNGFAVIVGDAARP